LGRRPLANSRAAFKRDDWTAQAKDPRRAAETDFSFATQQKKDLKPDSMDAPRSDKIRKKNCLAAKGRMVGLSLPGGTIGALDRGANGLHRQFPACPTHMRSVRLCSAGSPGSGRMVNIYQMRRAARPAVTHKG